MPAILSHHLFGRAILARQTTEVSMNRDARDAFLLGNQGMDPLFFATRTPSFAHIKMLGSRMHHERIEEYLELWRSMLDRLSIKDFMHESLEAYVYGLLCHYALDRAVHPLVFSYERALCHAGVAGLDANDHSVVHGQIEADLDVYLLYRLTGRTLEEYRIPKQVLYCNDRVLSSIDTLYRAAASLFHIKVPPSVFTRSVKDMRAAMKLLYSPGGTKRELLGATERLVRKHSLLQAISHRPEACFDTWYANDEREDWTNPFTDQTCNASFLELFNKAQETALADIDLYKRGAPVVEITKGMDFFGDVKKENGKQ